MWLDTTIGEALNVATGNVLQDAPDDQLRILPRPQLVRHGTLVSQMDITAAFRDEIGAIDGLGEVIGPDRIAPFD